MSSAERNDIETWSTRSTTAEEPQYLKSRVSQRVGYQSN